MRKVIVKILIMIKKGKKSYAELQELVPPEIRTKWENEQNSLKQKLILTDDFDWSPNLSNLEGKKPLKLVGGLDMSFSKVDEELICAGLVVCEFPSMKIVYEDFQFYKIDVPYVPGFLAFRELPATQPLIEKLRKTKPELVPQVVLVDGNGILHPREFGLASHLGVVTDIPSIGVGKTVFALDGINKVRV
eukprot:TRINITY_DN1818_c0_g1_i4.p2 TRINITY_DN1818_c0_g1~~TRINITY_DN1818_c0_g1_i4.p2  ORF type:complete len:190 (+),score=50.72 TRINITY_DN1818_c0_g1_i4:173-742(+)